MKKPTNAIHLEEFVKNLNEALSDIKTYQAKIKYLEKQNKTAKSRFEKTPILERLGVFYLAKESTETKGFDFLSKANKLYNELYKRNHNFPLPQNTLSYKFPSLVKDFIPFLKRQRKKSHWPNYLSGGNREFLFSSLGLIYNDSLKFILDTPQFNLNAFKKIIRNSKIRGFVKENYDACYHLFMYFESTERKTFLTVNDEYPIARVIIVMYGAALEGILLDCLKKRSAYIKDRKPIEEWPLGKIINVCFEKGFINPLSRLSILCILIWFFRNYIHPGQEIQRKKYFIDVNLAKIICIAFHNALIELIKLKNKVTSNPF